MIVRITRVKVGNRQAPQQHQKPHPTKGGVSAFTETLIDESLWVLGGQAALDIVVLFPHNHQFSAEGCPSG